MGTKKITELQLRSNVSDDLNFPSDDGLQSYRVTAAQLYNYINSKFSVYRSVTSTDSVGALDYTMKLSGASFTSTLPTAVGVAGKRYKFVHAGTSLSQVYTIDTTSSQTIGGVAGGSYALVTNGEVLEVESDGANWMIVGRKTRTTHVAWTPTLNGTGLGTISNASAYWYREGNMMHAEGVFTTGTVSANSAAINLPSNIAIDGSKLSIPSNNSSSEGTPIGQTFMGGTATNGLGLLISAPGTSTALVYFAGVYGITGVHLAPTTVINSYYLSSALLGFKFSIPVAGWQP